MFSVRFKDSHHDWKRNENLVNERQKLDATKNGRIIKLREIYYEKVKTTKFFSKFLHNDS